MTTAQETILIVEDDPAIARLLEVYLSERGYSVLMATRGEQALEICRATPPDLILLDIRLPDISGYDVGMALRSAPDTQNIPIVVLTAFSEKADRLSAHDLVRADYFLGKPFDIEELVAVIRNQLSDGRRRGQYHPITNLPTGELVNARLRALLTASGWTMALIRVNGFEQFTQLYGVVSGENVLKFSALQLSDVVRERGAQADFVGQMVVGAYFIVISQPRQIRSIAEELIRRFEADIHLHYDYRDRQRGRFSPMTLTVGVLSAADGPFGDIRELTEAAEDLLQASEDGPRRSAIVFGRPAAT